MRLPVLALAAGLCLVGATVPALAQKGKAPAKAAAKAPKYDEAKLKALEAKLAKKPNDAKLKLEVAEAAFQIGYAMEYNPNLPPRVKYPGALKHFRRALQLNPKHAKAAAEKEQIESIYRSMGRPVPQ